MTPKQARFVAEYLKDFNATQAAIRAGFSAKTAAQQASRLLTNVKVQEAVAAAQAKHVASDELTAARVLEEYRRLSFCDLRSFFDADGNLTPVTELTADQGSALAGLEVIKKNAAAGDGHIDVIHKFKLWDKTRALESLAKHFGLLQERLEHSGGIDLMWKDSE